VKGRNLKESSGGIEECSSGGEASHTARGRPIISRQPAQRDKSQNKIVGVGRSRGSCSEKGGGCVEVTTAEIVRSLEEDS